MPTLEELYNAKTGVPNSSNEEYWRRRLANQGELRATPPKSLWRTFIDSFTPGGAAEETMRRGPAGLITSYVAPLVPTGEGETYNERRKALAAKEKQRRQDYDTLNAPKNAGEFVAELPASIVGSLISDPTNLITGGAKTLGGKALTAAGVGGAADVALQGGELASGLRDEYSPLQTGINVAAGPVFVGAGHAAGRGLDRYRESRSLKEAAILGRQFGRVTSLTRTPEHNKKVGGVPGSYHTKGRAMDIARAKGVSHADIVREFKARGYHLVEALDEGDHTHLAFDFKKGTTPNPRLVAERSTTTHADIEDMLTPKARERIQQLIDEDPEIARVLLGDQVKTSQETAIQQADNVVDLNQVRQQKITKDLYEYLTGEKAPDNLSMEDMLGASRQPFKETDVQDVLTPAERQDMDASVPVPPAVRGALSEDIVDSVVGQGRAATTPVNDTRVGRFNKYTDGPFQSDFDKYSGTIEREIKARAVSDALNKRGPFKNREDFEAAMKEESAKYDSENTATVHPIRKLLKDIINDEEGSFRPFGRNKDGESGPTGPDEPSDTSLFGRLTTALKEADSLKGEQAEMAHVHRAKQALKMENAAKSVRGRARLYAMRHAQKGEIEKPKFTPIEDKFTPEEIDTMSDYISEFTGWTSVHDSANALDGWNKLLKGTIPTQSELALLEKVLPRDAITAIIKHMPRDTAELVVDALNIPRSVLSSFDVSAPGRQGVFLVGRKEYWQGLPDMIRQFGSEEAHQAIQKAIRDDPDFHLAEKAGLATQDTQVRLGGKEENFNSNLAEKYIPGVRMSDRSFSGYLHKLRFDVFKSIVDSHRELGVDVTNPKYLKSLGAYLNAATGRGDLPKLLERWAPALNAMLFSPRLMASRLQLLNPVFYAKMHPKVRAEALKDLSRFTSVAGSILGVAALAGATISLDSNSADFLKIKIGDRRYDVLGGFQQYMVLGSRIKEYLAGQIGLQEKKKGLEQTNLQNAPARFVRTKLAPIPSAIIDSWLGKDVVGQDTNVIKEAFGLVTPMSAGDIAEAAYDDGLLEGALALPSLGGIGYAKYKKKTSEKDKKKSLESKFNAGSSSETLEAKFNKKDKG